MLQQYAMDCIVDVIHHGSNAGGDNDDALQDIC